MKKGLYLTFVFKRIKFGLILIFFIIAFCSFVALNNNNAVYTSAIPVKPVIVIDAGHGGEDGGTSSDSGVLEKDINLLISKKLEKILKRYGFRTVMIRTDDKLIYNSECSTIRQKKVSDIHNRLAIMKKYEGCIFISIHQNHFSESKYSGAQVFYSKNTPESAVLADSIQKSIVKSLQNENKRQIKQCTSSVYLMYNAVTTAVMVECGFMSNRQEAEMLTKNSYQYEMALAIAHGLIEYLQTKGSG